MKKNPNDSTTTKTYTIPIKRMLRWKLTPEDATVLKLSLMGWSSKHLELERRRKSLLNRMKGDFFLILYANGGGEVVSSECNCAKVQREDTVKKEKKQPEFPFASSSLFAEGEKEKS
jgi:hypothetical protein